MVDLTTIIILVIALLAVFIAFRIGHKVGGERKHQNDHTIKLGENNGIKRNKTFH